MTLGLFVDLTSPASPWALERGPLVCLGPKRVPGTSAWNEECRGPWSGSRKP
jgi:hypothetical protein